MMMIKFACVHIWRLNRYIGVIHGGTIAILFYKFGFLLYFQIFFFFLLLMFKYKSILSTHSGFQVRVLLLFCTFIYFPFYSYLSCSSSLLFLCSLFLRIRCGLPAFIFHSSQWRSDSHMHPNRILYIYILRIYCLVLF